ncbi:hypothetical protein ES708_31487 [subsurface metagenome]
MRDRILHFLTRENISSAKFADNIGVQRSSVSHILSGRNNPSFDFIQKILRRFELLNAEWLILGRGEMYKSRQQGIMFDSERRIEGKEKPVNDMTSTAKIGIPVDFNDKSALVSEEKLKKTAEKVVIFYTDKTFKEYYPQP